MDNELEKIIERVQKLMSLAHNNSNENEATAALARAQELMEKYNIQESSVNSDGKGDGYAPRKDNKKQGGLYKWQRDIWEDVAEANFCLYYSLRGLKKGDKYQHRVIGSKANVITTEYMAEYLQGTIERLAREYAKEKFPKKSVFIRELIAYREGMARRICERLRDLRHEREEEIKRKRREEEARARHPGAAPSNSTALTVAEVRVRERDYNLDYLYGLPPGTRARQRAEYEAKKAAERAEQKKWEEDNPIEAAAAKKAEEERREREYQKWKKREERNAKRRKGEYKPRKLTAEEERQELSTFRSGYDRGDSVSLHRQADAEKRERIR